MDNKEENVLLDLSKKLEKQKTTGEGKIPQQNDKPYKGSNIITNLGEALLIRQNIRIDSTGATSE